MGSFNGGRTFQGGLMNLETTASASENCTPAHALRARCCISVRKSGVLFLALMPTSDDAKLSLSAWMAWRGLVLRMRIAHA